MKVFATGIYGLLSADAALTALCPGGVHKGAATQGTTGRYVVFSWMDDPKDTHTLTNGYIVAPLLVKAVDESEDDTNAEAAASRVDLLMPNLTVVGWNVMQVLRKSRPSYVETKGDRTWQHCGRLYWIWAQEGA